MQLSSSMMSPPWVITPSTPTGSLTALVLSLSISPVPMTDNFQISQHVKFSVFAFVSFVAGFCFTSLCASPVLSPVCSPCWSILFTFLEFTFLKNKCKANICNLMNNKIKILLNTLLYPKSGAGSRCYFCPTEDYTDSCHYHIPEPLVQRYLSPTRD